MLALVLTSAFAATVAIPDALTVLSLTPSASSPTLPATVPVSGHEALTVTFTRAVIALGADFLPGELPASLVPFHLTPSVPGKLRWVTTSIARFDPDGEWPHEHVLSLSLNPDLQSFDGASLAAGQRTDWTFVTPQLSMTATSVHSATALALTNGSWSSSLHPLARGVHECPPDGKVELTFNTDVEREVLGPALRLYRSDGHAGLIASARVSLAPCRRPSRRCTLATLVDAPLDAGALYTLVLPAGSRFHHLAGKTHAQASIGLSGLVPFAFPFVDYPSFRARYRRLRLWVRHGLMDGVAAADVLPTLRLARSDSGDALTLSVKRTAAAVLQLEAPALEPDVAYTLTVRASDTVRDGFGLPLRGGSLAFTTSRLSSFFSLPGIRTYGSPPSVRISAHNATAASAALVAWPALLRGDDLCAGYGNKAECWRHGKQPQASSLHAVGSDDVRNAIATLRSSQPAGLLSASSLVAELTSEGAPNRQLTSRSADLRGHLLRPPGVLLQSSFGVGGGTSHSHALLSAGHVAAVALAVPGDSLLVWALNATSGEPLRGATVELLGASCYSRCTATDVQRLGQTSSSADGIATFPKALVPSSPRSPTLYVVVSSARSSGAEGTGYRVQGTGEASTPPAEMLVLSDVPAPGSSAQAPPLSAVLLTDRAVYQLNETVRLKGYVRSQDASGQPEVPDASVLAFKLRVRWGRSAGRYAETPVRLDKRHGAFDATLHVPADATYGEHQLTLQLDTSGLHRPYGEAAGTVASTTIAIADPRPPTVELQVSSPERVIPPNGTLALRVQTRSLSGVPLKAQKVLMRWTLTRGSNAPAGLCAGGLRECAPAMRGAWWEGDSNWDDASSDGGDGDGVESDAGSGEATFTTGGDGTVEVDWRPTRTRRLPTY